MSDTNMTQSLPRTAMIGDGSMSGAILSGLRASGIAIPKPIAITTKSAASAAAFADIADVVAVAAENDADANRKAVRDAGLVILGVKPWMIADVTREIAGDLQPGTIVVSVAAGVPAAAIEELLPAGIPVVRAMPNTPSHIGRGMTGVAGGASADDASIEIVRRLFETVGEVIVVREDQISHIAAVSGSGPAYLYHYAEEMEGAAERLGFTAEQARLLVQQTIVGAAELMLQSDKDPAQLRRDVTSPKGTTEQAMIELMGANLGELYDRAMAANVRRSLEMERGE